LSAISVPQYLHFIGRYALGTGSEAVGALARGSNVL
jgi:hypothetical protein